MSQHNKPNYRNPPDLVDEQPPSYDEVLSEESRRYVESSRILQEQHSPYYLTSHSQRNQPAYYPYQGPHYQAIPHPHVLQSAQVDELYYFPTNAALFLLGL
jgi:hypothetical protein